MEHWSSLLDMTIWPPQLSQCAVCSLEPNSTVSLFVFNELCLDVPDVSLQIGASLNKSNIRENSDVYFECL